VKVFHAPISFAADGSDNPNKHLGILRGVNSNMLFVRGTWNADICDAMKPEPEDMLVVGKTGLSAFPNTNFEELLLKNNIETIAIGGFMANCCVESTMRDACEKGYNVITLTDCVATTSMAGYKAATEITYPFFSTPMNAASFLANLNATVELSRRNLRTKEPSSKRTKRAQPQSKQQKVPYPKAEWAVRSISGEDVYQFGPWFVDVRNNAVGEKVVLESGEKELSRYLRFAEASGMMGSGICAKCDAIYTSKLPKKGVSTEPFGWLCNMTVVRLSGPHGGCLIYSPVLSADDTMTRVVQELTERQLLPVRIVIAPTPQHHLALLEYQHTFPEAFFICGKASGQMPPLTKSRRDLRFDGVLCTKPANRATGAGSADRADVFLGAAVCDGEGSDEPREEPGAVGAEKRTAAWELLQSVFQVCIADDNRTGEIVMLHRQSKTLLMSDLLYKSNPAVTGPGGGVNHYTTPDWFAEGQQELFYSTSEDNAGGLLPTYRTHPRMRSIDIPGMRRSLEQILSWDFDRALACHTDPIDGSEAQALIKQAWAWVWLETGGIVPL
jgi:nicotinamidase-related amidase